MGEGKTKCILIKKGKKGYTTLNITRNKNKIKQYSVFDYLGCLLVENMSRESMAKRALKKLMEKTKFRYRQKRYLSYHLKRMLCNSLTQPHFDFACYARYPYLSMSLKNKLQTAQKACIRFCLGMERRSHKNNLSPVYMSDIYTLNSYPVVKTRRFVDSFVEPICMKEISRKSIPYFGSKIWNGLDKNIKTNSFKHALKKQFLKPIRFLVYIYIYIYYIYIYIYLTLLYV